VRFSDFSVTRPPGVLPHVKHSLMAGVVVLAATACNKDEGVKYDQYNAPDDTLTIEVGTADLLDAIEIPLMSSTGQVEVGLARVDPGGGPIGTNHDFVVEVYDAYEDVVDRASVRLQSPGRGVDEYDLEQDSADEGVYLWTLESVGSEGETRADSVTFRLWTQSENQDSTE
jgi:hypothetical protein